MALPLRNLYKCKQVACSVVVACCDCPLFFILVLLLLVYFFITLFIQMLLLYFDLFVDYVNKPIIFVSELLFMILETYLLECS